MAPLDWDHLMQSDPDSLEDEAADEWYQVLEEFELGDDEQNVDRIKKLFEVTKTVMILKNTQAEVAEEELKDIMSNEGKSTAKKDQDIEDLRREVAQLRRENKDLQRYGSEGVKAITGKDETRYLRDQVMELESTVEKMELEAKERETHLREEKMTLDTYIERTDKAEKELRDLKRENEQLRDDIRDLQRQIESQRESILAKRDDDTGYRDKMTQKNKLLSGALEENQHLAEANVELEDKIKEMKKEMREGKDEIERTTDDYLKLKMVVDKSDSIIDSLRRENNILQDQIQDLMEQVKTKADMDDEIMVRVNDKVEQWKSILADKDQHIMKLEDEMLHLRDQLIAANMDSEKTSVAALSRALEDRDRQINELKQRMEDIVGEMEGDAALMEDCRGEMTRAGKGDRHMMKISQLQGTLKYHESQLKDAESRALEAESDARQKDKELNEAWERVGKLENGEYGLPEAVAEIKELKQQINARDRQIEELTKHINENHEQLNDLYDETEDLRERLGLDPKEPLDLTEFKKKKGIRMQEDRALNRILQKEIEALEEERLEMKAKIRKLAQLGGTRAVALGLEADDMARVEEYIEDLKERKKPVKEHQIVKTEAVQQELKARMMQHDAEVGQKNYKLDHMSRDNAELKAKNKELNEENKTLEKGLREIHAAIKEQADAGVQSTTIQCPTLERMLAAIETKNLLGTHDTSLYLKAQVDNLTGHNEELRKELREVRYEATRAHVDLQKQQTKAETLEVEVKSLKEAGAGGFFQAMTLPEGMAVASSDVIASLNERLVQVLQELHLKEEMVGKMEESLDTYRRKFAVVRHQQGLLYQEYNSEKKQWEDKQEELRKRLSEVEGRLEDDQVRIQEFDVSVLTDQVRIQEFDRLLNTLSKEEPEVRRQLADTTRKVTVLRVNEKALTRKFTALQEMEGYLRRDNNKLRNEMILMEAAVAERLGYLQRHKEMTTFKMASLQRMLDDSVPEQELDSVNKKFTELTEKYRDQLEKSNTLVARTEAESGYEVEVKRLLDDNNYLKRELGIEKEKLHTLEAAFEKMKTSGAASSKNLRDSEVISISKKLTTLEMKELNERQRAEHANRMYETQKKQLRELEDRNFELEQKFAELTRVNIDQQHVERNLRDELANCVTKAVSNADRKKIVDLEGRETSLRVEVSKLKDIAEVASSQVSALESQQISREKEVTSLRQQLLDFQAQSDEKTIIGKLHRHIVQLQISEGMALRKSQEANSKKIKLEAQCLRIEQRMDDKDQTIYHNRLESRSKVKYLKHTVQDLRSKYSGAVPLQDQEKFAKQMMRITEEKYRIELDYKQTNEERRKVEDKLDEVEVQHKGLQDLLAILKDGKGAQKVVEWQNKMEQVRLEDLRLKREVDRLKEQMKFQDGILKKHEVEVLSLEEEKVRLTREFDNRQLEWEHREVELERIITNMEHQQAEIAGAATQFEDAVGALPDSSLPIPQQLEIAVTTIRNNVKLVLDARAESAFTKKKIDELQQEVKEKNKEVLSRDRVINELRLRLPASAERDKLIAKATAKSTGSAAPGEDEDVDYESRQAVRVAQSTVHHLQQRVHQKDETIQKYQELLRQARDDMQGINQRHEDELRLMQEKLNNKTDVAFHKYKQSVQDSLSVKAGSKIITNDQLRRLNELEDIVADQDNSIAALREKLTKARQEIQDWRFKHDEALRQYTEDKDGLLGEHSEAVNQVRTQMERTRQELEHKQRECDMLLEELQGQKEANSRAPTATMKKLVERLRNELALKEKQHQALSKALMELRGEMVSQAQDEVKAHAQQNALEFNVQKLVDKESKELKVRLEEMDGQLTKLRKEKKKFRETETTLTTELDETRQELAKREGQLRKAQSDRQRLEKDVEELERKVDRMNTMGRQVAGSTGLASNENLRQELDELRRKNRLLQDEMKRSRHQAEKPYEQQGKDAASSETVAKWEEGKKWQKQSDRLKTRLKEKEVELERLNKSNEMLKNALERANKDKELLEQRLRTASRGQVERPISRDTMGHVSAAPPPKPQEVHSAEDMKTKIYQLEEENINLKRQLTQGKDAAFQEVQLRNKFLADKLEVMEQQLGQKAAVRASQEGSVGQNTYRELAKKEADLQKDVIRLTEENLELRFEVDQAKKDVPRLKSRVEDQEKYVEILKEEKRQLEIMRSSSRSLDSLGSLGSSLSGNYKRIGESGKSTRELEKTIALLKKVVDKVRTENAELKKAPGVVSNDQLKMLQAENHGLKTQLEELRSKMGGTLSERYVSQQKGTARVMADHDKLRRDLLKSQEETERWRVQVKDRDLSVEKLRRALEDAETRAERAEAKHPSLASMGSKEWSSVVLPKMSEEKLKSLGADLDKKNTMLAEVKVLLREAANREHDLLEEKRELEDKVEVLERFPQGAPTGASDVVRDLQLARLKVDRLENEKRQLVNEVQLLRKHPVDQDADQVVHDLTTNNKLRTENVELRTQLRSVELGREKQARECDKLRKELSNFGPDFFNEIEDLKYNYRESVQRNVQYEEQLAKLSRQFGVSVDIPGGV